MEQTIYPVPVNTRFLTAKYQQYKQIAHQYKEKLMTKHEQMIQPRLIEQSSMNTMNTMTTMEREWMKMYDCKMTIIKNLLAVKEITFQQNKVLKELYNLVKMRQWKCVPATLEQELELVQSLYMYYPKQGIYLIQFFIHFLDIISRIFQGNLEAFFFKEIFYKNKSNIFVLLKFVEYQWFSIFIFSLILNSKLIF